MKLACDTPENKNMHNAILDILGKDGNKETSSLLVLVQLKVEVKEINFSMKKEKTPQITSEMSTWQHYLAMCKGNRIFE